MPASDSSDPGCTLVTSVWKLYPVFQSYRERESERESERASERARDRERERERESARAREREREREKEIVCACKPTSDTDIDRHRQRQTQTKTGTYHESDGTIVIAGDRDVIVIHSHAVDDRAVGSHVHVLHKRPLLCVYVCGGEYLYVEENTYVWRRIMFFTNVPWCECMCRITICFGKERKRKKRKKKGGGGPRAFSTA
jgi:hypothetical protein